jgi:hypothetical protein
MINICRATWRTALWYLSMTTEVKLVHMQAIKLYRGQSMYICMIPYDIHSMNIVSGIFHMIPENMWLAP